MAEPVQRSRRALLIKIAVVAIALLVLVVLGARGLDLMSLVNQGLDLIRQAGPVVFFVAMALLPAVGAPILAFSLTVGPAFSERLGMPAVMVFSLVALLVNMSLSYFLARRALRPLLEKLVARLGYKLPQVGAGDASDLIVLLRVMGLPFPVQNYLLGFAEVPFKKYLLLSSLIVGAQTVAVIYFGDALLHGKGKIALIGLSVLIALTVGTHLVRRHYGTAKKKP